MNRPPNAQRRSEKSHQATLAAAMDLCVEQGYGKVTVEAIAARAGVSKKTIYRWWPTKGAVVLEALIALVGKATQFPDTGDVAADMRTQMTAVLDNVMTGPHAAVYAGVIAEAQHDETLAHNLLAHLLQPRIEAARDRLRLAREKGQLAPDADVELAVDLLYGPVYYRLLLNLGMYSREQLHTLIDLVIGAFAPVPATPPAPDPG
ncbi:TetR/AcrR family transcriptional regulator [Streptomyces polyrhachis]|uniref:TetR/AcrR family transcriptional regulator n=1 Tax=Streptomyces polyrhachis TaxID=1282885 RepID=A0ABW2GHP4_9ACTN